MYVSPSHVISCDVMGWWGDVIRSCVEILLPTHEHITSGHETSEPLIPGHVISCDVMGWWDDVMGCNGVVCCHVIYGIT